MKKLLKLNLETLKTLANKETSMVAGGAETEPQTDRGQLVSVGC